MDATRAARQRSQRTRRRIRRRFDLGYDVGGLARMTETQIDRLLTRVRNEVLSNVDPGDWIRFLPIAIWLLKQLYEVLTEDQPEASNQSCKKPAE